MVTRLTKDEVISMTRQQDMDYLDRLRVVCPQDEIQKLQNYEQELLRKYEDSEYLDNLYDEYVKNCDKMDSEADARHKPDYMKEPIRRPVNIRNLLRRLSVVILLISSLTLTACDEQHGESVPVEKSNDKDPHDYQVVKLFEVDGISMYKFRDTNGEIVYFTNGNGKTHYEYQIKHTTYEVEAMCNGTPQDGYEEYNYEGY